MENERFMASKTKTDAAARFQVRAKPMRPSTPAKTPLTLGGPVMSLEAANFRCSETGEVCGRVWLVTGDPELARKHGGVPLPKSLEERCLPIAPLGVITETSVAGAYMTAKLNDLSRLLDAIRTSDVKRLHAVNRDYAPFYCPKCEKRFVASLWSSIPIYDDGFYDYTEVTCPTGHINRILD
jgi:hypothetical protein